MTADPAHLIAALGHLDRGRAVCVGDLMLDRFVYGDVERISPEAPIPVVRVDNTTTMLGGAGNVVRNLAALGCPSTLVAVVGDDPDGAAIRDLLAAEPLSTPQLLADPARPTTSKARYVAGAQQLLRADHEVTAPLPAVLQPQIIERATQALADAAGGRALILSDYAKGVLEPGVLRDLIAAAGAAGAPVVVDPTGNDYAVYAGATLLTPNRAEIQRATRLPAATDAEVVAAGRHVIDNCGVASVLVTRGAEGMTLVEQDGPPRHFPALAQEVFDVSGAGDTVAAVITAGLAGGLPVADAAQLANIAAGIAVSKVGTAAVTTAEIARAIRGAGGAKIVTRDTVADLVAQWRGQGLRIGFTNGCFDVLHPGHVALLDQAATACDRLVVALNTDASVQRLKGPDRPVQSETARAQVMASLSSVDAVVLFDEDTPLALIESLAPDVLVKGADYRIDQVVGADVVQRAGGEVLLVPISDGHSTTATIARMATPRRS